MSESLTNKTLKGVGWNSIDRIANYGISFIVSIILARLLTPEDYGLIGIITIFISIFNTILDGGLSTALIRKKDVSDADYNTVFYSNIALSLFLTAVLFLSAPLISDFFDRPELTPLVRAMSGILVINAISIVQQSILTKRIDFKSQTQISIISSVTSGVIGIALAFSGVGVWALVAQQLSLRLLATILLFFYNRWWPRCVFSWNSFRDLFGFGWKLLTTRVLGSLWGQLYQGIIGKCYSPATLGLYTRAAQYGQMFSSGIADVVLKVSLPVMSSIQDDRERLIAGTRKIIRITCFVTSIIMFGMAASAHSMIYVLIGERWLPCVPFMQILCMNLLFNPLAYLNENLLTVEGRSDKLLVLQFWKMGLSVLPLVLGILGNIYMMLISSAVLAWFGIFLYTYYTKKYFGYGWQTQVRDIAPSIGISLFMSIPVLAMNWLPISPFIIFPLQIVLGAAMVILIGELRKMEEYMYIKDIVVKGIDKIRK